MTTLLHDLPADWREGVFLGRLGLAEGPTPVLVRKGRVYDISAWAPTTAKKISVARTLKPPPRSWVRGWMSVVMAAP